jgi:hypothetical protein
LATLQSLTKLKIVLSDFATFSGLRCNVEKTTITLVGDTRPISQEIKDLGFNFVNEFTLLGLKISNDIDNINNVFTTTIEKILSIREFWDRLKLTLPGRIAVAKTFMLSQIGYFGSIITPSIADIRTLQKTIDDFCIGKIKIAQNRKYIPPASGGMGLINLNDFIISLQSSWIKRVYQHGADNWRFDLLQKTYGNPFLLNSTLVSKNDHPIISNIAESYEKFCKIYYDTGMNYKKSYILSNPLFVRRRRDNGLLCRQFFGRNTSNNIIEIIANLKLEDFVERNAIKTLDQLNMDTRLNFTLVEYMRLSEALVFFLDKKRTYRFPFPLVSRHFFSLSTEGQKKSERHWRRKIQRQT